MKKLLRRNEAFRRGSGHSDFLVLATLVFALILVISYCAASQIASPPTTLVNLGH